MFKLVITIIVSGFVALFFAASFQDAPKHLQMLENNSTKNTTKIVLLGTGTPNADPERSGPSVAIVINGTAYIIDFGPGVVRRAAAAARTGTNALRAPNLTRAFVTHLHSDHTAGLSDLIFTPWVLGRNVPLEIYGPPGTKHMSDHILTAYEEDIAIRIQGLEPANTEGYKVNVFEAEPGVLYRDEKVRVNAFQVNHGSWNYAYGFRFETPDRTVVISGDTAPSENLVKNAQGCDVLIHEVYSDTRWKTRPVEWQRYHRSFHTSTYELADMANRIKPGLLILYHQLPWGSTPDEMLAEIAQTYNGKVVYGNDLDVY